MARKIILICLQIKIMKTSLILLALLVAGISACNSDHSKISSDADMEQKILHPKFDENKIHGLGIFKIGSLSDVIINQLMSTGNYKYDSLSLQEEQNKLKRKQDSAHIEGYEILKLNPPLSTFDEYKVAAAGEKGYKPVWCKEASTYFIEAYFIDSMVVRDLLLRFYKDRLISVQFVLTPNVKGAIASKFGNSNETGVYINGDIEAKNLKPTPGYHETFEVEIAGSTAFLNDCSGKDFAKQNAIDKENKAKGLKNL